MHKRIGFKVRAGIPGAVLVLTCLCLFAGLIGLAYAVTEDDLKAELTQLQSSMQAATEAYEEQEQKLAEIQAQMIELQTRIDATEGELADARGRLSDIVVQRYRGSDQFQLFEILLSAQSFKDFIVAYEYSARMGEHFAGAVHDARVLGAQLADQRAEMTVLEAEQVEVTDSYRKQMAKLQDQLASKESEFEALREKLAAERAAANVAAGIPAHMDVTVSVGANGFVFPVVGSYSYIDSFYAARATGMHGATDIMAPYGTPIVAFTSGTWSRCDNGLGGIAGYVNGSNGWSAYYGHMQTAIGSGPVSAGEVIGTVGDTGNAAGTPHLHIEIWDASGALINPYPLLRAME
ncbi:MAG: peptidoglycan DD-metalloendopeptidase family protein [Actinomycetia bacterium]|nr:peptidoglycan DD-metalloendopeptidase family protein [Actinomycetes bacterium]